MNDVDISAAARPWTRSLAGAALVAGLLGGGVAHAQEVTMRLAHVAPPTSSYQDAAVAFADALARQSDGAVGVQIIPGGALGNMPQLWAQLQAGAIDLHLIDVGAVVAMQSGREFLAVWQPYMFRDLDHWRAYLASPLFEEMMGDLESAAGIEWIGYLADRPPRALSTSDTPVAEPTDLEGLKIRVLENPLIAEVFAEWGANPTPVPGAELFMALRTGLVDGQDNGIVDVVATGMAEVQSYYTPLNYVQSGIGLWMSGSRWESLTPETQGWVRAAAAEALAAADATFQDTVDAAFAAAEEMGMTIVEPDIPAFREISDPTIAARDGAVWPEGLAEQIQAIE